MKIVVCNFAILPKMFIEMCEQSTSIILLPSYLYSFQKTYETKPDAVRIGIANALELIFRLSLCSMITELHH